MVIHQSTRVDSASLFTTQTYTRESTESIMPQSHYITSAHLSRWCYNDRWNRMKHNNILIFVNVHNSFITLPYHYVLHMHAAISTWPSEHDRQALHPICFEHFLTIRMTPNPWHSLALLNNHVRYLSHTYIFHHDPLEWR